MIRIANLGDLPAIVLIYNEAIASRFATGDLKAVTVDAKLGWFSEHEPMKHPIFIWEEAGELRGWCSLSAYRRGRAALRFTAEISYYVREDSQRRGIASALARHALAECTSLQIKNVFAIVLEPNAKSCALLEKLSFERWGFLPNVADFNGQECGHVYYGRRVSE
jgi:L-amino acid N-acyltransferase YncA